MFDLNSGSDLFDISWSSTAASLYLCSSSLLTSCSSQKPLGFVSCFFPSSFVSGEGEGWSGRGWKVGSETKEEGIEKEI